MRLNPRTMPLLASLGCAGTEPSVPGDTGSAPTPSIEVPAGHDFGAVGLGDGSTAYIGILNQGDAPLEIVSASVDGHEAYQMEPWAGEIPPGSTVMATVVFAPREPWSHAGLLRILSDDPVRPEVTVALTGTGAGGILEVTPASLDFGDLPVGCDAEMALSLANQGNVAVQVSGLVLDDEGSFSLTDLPDGTWDLGPGETRALQITATPEAVGIVEDRLTISSDAYEPGESTIPLTVRGVERAPITDAFPLEWGAADILLAVDRTVELGASLEALAPALTGFTMLLEEAGVDYHIALVVDGDGCVNGATRWIDRSFTGTAIEWTAEAMLELGWGHDANAERAFTLLAAALAADAEGGCNEGLVRPDAALHLVGVSDEPEQSAKGWDHFVALFRARKEDPADVQVHGIGGCGYPWEYTGVYEAAVETGGIILSICDDWSANFADLAAAVAAAAPSRTRFALSATPVASTLEVAVDGVLLASGWTWDAAAGEIVLEAALEGSVLTATYLDARDCG